MAPEEKAEEKKKEKELTAAEKKKKKEEEDDLSDEDKELQAQMALLVTRTSDPEPSLRLAALETMVKEVRTSTSSMTSVPKPLKFLRPHYDTLKSNYTSAAEGPAKTMLADVLSLLAMTMAEDGTRESLSYKMLGSRDDLGSWGHEYVRHLSISITTDPCSDCECRQTSAKPS
jgi:26S proteasome regulatory subunit N1